MSTWRVHGKPMIIDTNGEFNSSKKIFETNESREFDQDKNLFASH